MEFTIVTQPIFNHLVVLGVGLMGGSLALAAKQSAAVKTVGGWSRRQATLDLALKNGVIDIAHANLDEALKGADCVVIATPTQFTEALMADVLEKVGSNVVVTDVASVKGNILQALEQRFGQLPANAVLAHPIAGSEQSGVQAARANLFAEHRVILIDHAQTSADALQKVTQLWTACQAVVDTMQSKQHDAVLALTSHLPHFLAYALVLHLAGDKTADDIFRYAGGGFRDFTRIAASDPRMWREISMANKDELLSAVDNFQQHLQRFSKALAHDDSESLEQLFGQAKAIRDKFGSVSK
jgi:prephenate dehydrogenase